MFQQVVLLITLVVGAFTAVIPNRPVHPVFAKWNRHSKIVGGEEAVPHSLPYQVALFLGPSFCGGSLISDLWVLTAAHCGEMSARPQVVMGAHRPLEAEDSQVFLVGSKVIIHEQWNSEPLRNDIALILLPSKVQFSTIIGPVKLASANAGDYVGSTAIASGWGYTSDDSFNLSNVLRIVSSKVLTNDACKAGFGPNIPVYDGVICTDGSNGKSTCSGDSGGPLMVNGTQVGLTSYGSAEGCELGFPAAFTRITTYRTWITTQSGV